MSPKDQRQSEWEIRVSDYKASGMKMADWCSANHVTLEQLKYWIRKFKRLSSSVTLSAAIKPVVIGRKNFLFSNTPRVAKASAIIYSIMETAKANSLHPYMYLKYLFKCMPQLPDATDPEALSKLVPWYPSLPLICRTFSK